MSYPASSKLLVSNRIVLFVVGALIAMAVFTAAPPSTTSAATWNHVVNRTSAMCLDNNGGSTTNGTTIQQYNCINNSNLFWQLSSLGNGYHQLINQTSGKCLDNAGSTTAGTAIKQWSCNPSYNAQWQLVDQGNGYQHLVNRTSGMCLNNPAGTSNTSDMTQAVCATSADQDWRFELINIAKNKTTSASASCNANEGPEQAVNGTWNGGNSDKWCDNSSASKWWQVDLGNNYSLAQIVIQHAGAGGECSCWNTKDFDIQVSSDGDTWNSVLSIRGNTANTTSYAINVTGRYVKVSVIAGESSGATARLYEVQVFASSNMAAVDPGTNLALNKTASASGVCNADESAAKAVNGSWTGGTSDKWCDNYNTSKWWKVDLGANYSVSKFVIYHSGSGGGGECDCYNTKDFDILISTDNAAWSSVASITGNTQENSVVVIPATTARYVKLEIVNGEQGGNDVARIYEVEIYDDSTVAAVNLSVSPVSLGPGQSATVSWSNIHGATTSDWIGLYSSSTALDSAYLSYVYTSSCSATAGSTAQASGSCSLSMPTSAGTSYEFRLFANNGYTRLAGSPSVTVTSSNLTPPAQSCPPAWSSTTSYVTGDVVSNGQRMFYRAVQANSGNDPANDIDEVYWTLHPNDWVAGQSYSTGAWANDAGEIYVALTGVSGEIPPSMDAGSWAVFNPQCS